MTATDDRRIIVQGLGKEYSLAPVHAQVTKRRMWDWASRALDRYRPAAPAKPQPAQTEGAPEGKFWALKDINFEVRDADRVGIIGRNGAGKSTLLKILSRVAYPTEGEARIRGRVTSLLEIGTGFNPKLTGRDNIYLNASLYGLTRKEIRGKFDDIVEFSGVGKFLNLPVLHYSSGMRMRLAFAVAAHLDPDILLLDEVLAVGDLAFQQKCLKRVEGLTSQGRTILFVSHSLGEIARFCNRVIWLDQGRIRFDGDVAAGIALYQEEVLGGEGESRSLKAFEERRGTGTVKFTGIEILDEHLQPTNEVHTGQEIYIALYYECPEPLIPRPSNVFVFCAVENEKRHRLIGLPSEVLPDDLTHMPAAGRFLCRVKKLPLVPGVYPLTISLLLDRQLVDKVVGAKRLVVFQGDLYGTGKLPLASYGQVCTDFEWSVEPLPARSDAPAERPVEAPALLDSPR